MSKKILITGAAGFVGSHLVDLLLKKGIPISKLRLLLWNNESKDNLPNLKFDIIRGDIRDKETVKKAMKNVEIIYHLAAKIDFDGKTYQEYKETNVDGTKNLLEECKGKSIKKFVSYSSIGVYGLPAGIGNIINWDESHSPTYTNFYGKSKWEAEIAVREAHRQFGLSYSIIRPASVYGTREKGPTLALYKAINSGQFLMIGNGENKMHYVYVEDLVEATYLAANSKINNGEYIIAGFKPTKFIDIVRDVSNSIGKSVPNIKIPIILAMFVAHIFNILNKVTGIKIPLFPSRVKTMTSSYYYNISKAKKELGYNPKTSFSKGSEIVGKWYFEKGYL